MEIKQETLTAEIANILISFSKEWEDENCSHGYKANTSSDLEGRTILIAYEDHIPIGYLFGIFETTEKDTSTIPKNSKIFEIEEIFVKSNYRSMGIGKSLFYTLEDMLKDKIEYFTLSTATKNYKSILYFYVEELGMTFWSARLFKKTNH